MSYATPRSMTVPSPTARWPVMALLLLATLGCKRVKESAPLESVVSQRVETTHEKMFRDAAMIFAQHLRDESSGLFWDRVSLRSNGVVPSENYSTAATGMGFVVLALADAASLLPDAEEKFERGLASLDRLGPLVRSNRGWFLHWFGKEGAPTEMSRADGYSTIDTTILILGAKIAARYFSEKTGDDRLRERVAALEASIDWEQALVPGDDTALFLKFDFGTGEPDPRRTVMFNEYALLPCLAKDRSEKMAQYWQRQLRRIESLPTIEREGETLLTDHPEHAIPHFTLQFAHYLCEELRTEPDFQAYFQNAYRADRNWARSRLGDERLVFGLGAGSNVAIDVDDQGRRNVNYGYSADSLTSNPMLMVSPAIMAGFLPLDPVTITDELEYLWHTKVCSYDVGGFRTLWRCSLKDLAQPVEGIETVDYSTYVFGLSALLGEPTSAVLR